MRYGNVLGATLTASLMLVAVVGAAVAGPLEDGTELIYAYGMAASSDHLILVVGVEAFALTKVKPDQPVHLTSLSSDWPDCLAHSGGCSPSACKRSVGKVKRIGVAVDRKTRQVPVFIELPDDMAGCGKYFKAGIEVGKAP